MGIHVEMVQVTSLSRTLVSSP